jgi:hypothetical protein
MIVASLLGSIGDALLAPIVTAINLLIAAIGATITALVSLLPTLPTPPTPFSGTWWGWLNYFLPISDLIAGFVVWVGIWTAFLIIRTALKWVKIV